MYTRKDYLNGLCTHDEYYRQFVTNNIISSVVHCIGVKAILNSKDPHFNDIPLRKWDNLANAITAYIPIKVFKEADQGGISLGDKICILKTAARMIKENQK